MLDADPRWRTLRPRLLLVLGFGVLTVSITALFTASLFGVREASMAAAVVPFLAALLLLLAATWYLSRLLSRLERGIDRLCHDDFEPLPERDTRFLGPVGHRVNDLAALLRERQQSAEQSERLLHTLIDAAPMAILLLQDAGEIEYANEAARGLFFEGRTLEKANFLSMLSDAPEPFRDAVLDVQDRLFTVEGESGPEIYHLAKRNFELHGATHTLLMVKHLTRELRRQEIDIWKKLIRVVSHELNNSLAPIKSLVHSARLMTRAEPATKLDRVFSTIEERAVHLQDFVESYARFARLPRPRKEHVDIDAFLSHIETVAPYARTASPRPTGTAHFDRSQLEQVIINLLKNAREAGGPEEEILLDLRPSKGGGLSILVMDRGPGMSPEVLENAMLPFYSTKERGSGLGLALCREIIEAHDGKIRLENREGGGLLVTCTLPGARREETPPAARLTMSRV